ncbi:MAG: response regulator transcription factor [Nevskia sp.]|nr:response regulator transcription factor [Nevskia sp.]
MRLVLVEDSELVRDCLQRMLGQSPGIEVVGQAADEDEAVLVVQRTVPDAVVLDIALASGSGIGVLERLRNAGYSGCILMLTQNSQRFYREVCRKLGADGFFDKSAEFTSIVETLVELGGKQRLKLEDVA